MDALQLSLPLPVSVEEMYIDQAMFLDNSADFQFFAAYTPWGIKEIDSAFCTRIRNFERDPKDVRREILREYLYEKREYLKEIFVYKESRSGRFGRLRWEAREKLRHIGEDPKKLKDEILDNPHLHTGIKQNLIENLNRILTDLGLSVEMSPCR